MRVIADLHIHSRFSRATSKRINIRDLARFSKIKGLDLIATGDFTHPEWLKELQEDLIKEPNSGFFQQAKIPDSVRFIITGEVSTIFLFEGRTRKIHHLILTPSFETAAQINDRLSKYGNLSIDGRPILNMSAAQLVEEVMAISTDNEVIPAHVWTPWFSLFGAFSGFNTMEECYQDMTKHIHAIETGLSSDPPMNWRLSTLDKFTLLSNSDSHSCWPWRIGREANVFDLQHPSYDDVVSIIRKKDLQRFKFTIETNPAYGKYHWTGHRNCNVSMPPRDAIEVNNRCPMCRKMMTKGVEQRVEELADRPAGSKPSNAIDYIHLLPLSEIIATTIDASSPSVRQVWSLYDKLITKFGNEYNVLIDASWGEISKIVDPKIANVILRFREGKLRITPGYDGVYGQLDLTGKKTDVRASKIPQRSLKEWCNHP